LDGLWQVLNQPAFIEPEDIEEWEEEEEEGWEDEE
jgi:hypothetical protein